MEKQKPMIQKAKAFLTSDKQVFLTQDEAQKHELSLLFGMTSMKDSAASDNAVNCAMNNKDAILDILSNRKQRTPKAKPQSKSKKAQQPMEAA
jgi:hypothetical protein